ncbi:Nif3-like dinuclear metal center hexameric protein [Nigerium massiliense]|uniref:Nif3-like dinuclear metal center hexameric protein n=1 Tax=Nigerium massiliense TaxID=1522317 RepID=UPI00058EC8AB|nr:Nif3-like dinuclear metal center hexameric protein [Nigerium massiliense]
MLRVKDIVGWITEAYPPSLAEDWDRIGLGCGDPDAEVGSVLLAIDPTADVVAEARRTGAQLLLTHHPLLLRGLHAVRRDEPKGRVLFDLIEGGIAQLAAHTNADSAASGVSDALADVLGLIDRRPLQPQPGPALDKVVTFVPPEHVEAVIDALADAGAGAIGDYDRCAFTSPGTGQFRPLPGAEPFLGDVGELERTPEVRVELVLPRGRRAGVLRALRASHPYEEPAFDLLELAAEPSDAGLGRVGRLPEPLPAREVARRLAAGLPPTATGARLGGDPDRTIATVAVLGGAGDSLLDDVLLTDADLYVTSDLRHHPAQDFLARPGAPALVDVPHWAAEWTWLPHAEQMLTRRASEAGAALTTTVSTLNTDPWVERFGG